MQLATAQLDPDLDPFEVAGKFLMRSVLTRDGRASSTRRRIFYQVQKLQVRAMRVVEAVERLIGARPGQKLEVNFRAASLETTIRRAGRRLALGLVAAAALLGTRSPRRRPAWRRGSRSPSAWSGCCFVVALVVDLVRDRRDRNLSRLLPEEFVEVDLAALGGERRRSRFRLRVASS